MAHGIAAALGGVLVALPPPVATVHPELSKVPRAVLFPVVDVEGPAPPPFTSNCQAI